MVKKMILFSLFLVLFTVACSSTGDVRAPFTEPETLTSAVGPLYSKTVCPNEGIKTVKFYGDDGVLQGEFTFVKNVHHANGKVWYSFPGMGTVDHVTFHDLHGVVKGGGKIGFELCQLNSVPDDKFTGRIANPNGEASTICPLYASDVERIQQESDKANEAAFGGFSLE